MRRLFLALSSLLLIVAIGTAQDVAAGLAPHAERYNAQVSELQRVRKSQLSQAETEYVQKLDAAISSGKDEATIATLRKEREGVVKGLLAPGNPANLPEEIAASRRAFLGGAGKAAVEYNAAKKKLDDAYLKTLASLAKQAKGKSAPAGLAAEVAAEKRRVTRGY